MAAKRPVQPRRQASDDSSEGLPADSVVVKMVACRTGRGFRYVSGEVLTLPPALAGSLIAERAAVPWPPALVPGQRYRLEREEPESPEGAAHEDEPGEPETPRVRIADRMPVPERD